LNIFVSHATKDSELVTRICNFFEIHGIGCWTHENNISTRGTFQDKIADAIREADAFLVVLTRNSIESRNVYNEVYLAKEKEIVIPFLSENIKIPDRFLFELGTRDIVPAYDNLPSQLERILAALENDQ